MTLIDQVRKWNNTWRYDYWYRSKYNIAFNSKQHRAIDPLTIKFEYIESCLATAQLEQSEINEKKLKALKEGRWIEENIDQEKQDKLWDKIDLSKL